MLASLFSLPITPAQVPHLLGLNRGWGTMNTSISTAYNYKVVRQFAIMTVVWGIVGMGLGVFLAAQLVWPELNFNLPWLSFGRLRPLPTNVVFLGTLVKRKTKHIYVGNWFFGAFIITVGILHIVNNLELPVSFTKSYSV